jgi:hypothetical protein
MWWRRKHTSPQKYRDISSYTSTLTPRIYLIARTEPSLWSWIFNAYLTGHMPSKSGSIDALKLKQGIESSIPILYFHPKYHNNNLVIHPESYRNLVIAWSQRSGSFSTNLVLSPRATVWIHAQHLTGIRWYTYLNLQLGSRIFNSNPILSSQIYQESGSILTWIFSKGGDSSTWSHTHLKGVES